MDRSFSLSRVTRLLFVIAGIACNAGAATTEYFDYASFVAATRNLRIVTFDDVTAGAVMAGGEFDGLRITARRIAVVNPQDFAPGLQVGGTNVNSQPNGVSASLSYNSSRSIVFDNLDDNMRFDLLVTTRAAGIWIGNVGASNNDPVTPTNVSFLDKSGGTIAAEAFTQGHAGRVGSGANNRFFYGIVTDVPIGSISALNAPFDGDGIIYDDVLWAEPDAALDDIVVDFGPANGLWLRANHAGPTAEWRHLHGQSPTRMARGDVDGNGTAELIATFERSGVWTWSSTIGWSQLHPSDASDIVTGDLDGNGKADIILSFPGAGLWVRYNNETWQQLHGLNPTVLATGNVDNDAAHKSELIVDFAGYGVWIYTNNANWVQLHGRDADVVQTGDLDGNGQDDIVLNFPGQGIWIRSNNNAWSQLHGLNSSRMTVGNIDGDAQRRKDIVIDFTGDGVYARLNNSAWIRLHYLNAPILGVMAHDFNGQHDVVMNFTGYGVWIWKSGAGFEQLHGSDAEAIVTGQFDVSALETLANEGKGVHR
jgi:hypothetical protein